MPKRPKKAKKRVKKAVEKTRGDLEKSARPETAAAAYEALAGLAKEGERRSKGLDARQRKAIHERASRAFDDERSLLEQAGSLARKLNAGNMPEWIQSRILRPLGEGEITPAAAHERLEKKVPEVRRVSRLGANKGYETFTMRCIIGAGLGILAVETQPPSTPGCLWGALRDIEEEYNYGLCWAATWRPGVAVKAYAGIELCLWKRKPARLTGWYTLHDAIEFIAVIGAIYSAYARDNDVFAWAITPSVGIEIPFESVSPDTTGGGGIVAWLPRRTVDRIRA